MRIQKIVSLSVEPIDLVKIRTRPKTTTIYSGQTLFIGLHYHKGNAVKYKWDMGDGATKERDDSTVFDYQYTRPGIYLMTVYGYNEISNSTDAMYITVQDTITGMNMISSIDPMVPDTTFKIHWNIAKGMYFVRHRVIPINLVTTN